MRLIRAMATVGGLTLASRVLGFVRDVLTAALIGAGPVADAFFVALKLPNLFRRLTAEGAFTIAFVPLFTEKLRTAPAGEAKRFAEGSAALMLSLLIPMSAVMIAAMPWIIPVIAPGFIDEPERLEPAIAMARTMFPYLLLVSLSALFGAILNATGRFAAFAAAPLAFNISLIGGLVAAVVFEIDPGRSLAVSVTVAGLLQLLWMAMNAARNGWRLRLPIPKLGPDMRRLMTLMGPAVVGGGVQHVNILIDQILASLLAVGAVSWLYFADRLSQLPLGVIGIAIGTVLLPTLARQRAEGDEEGARDSLNRGIELAMLLSIPAAAALIAIPEAVIGPLLERFAFARADTVATAGALAAYALGIPGMILVKVLSTAYFAGQDTRTPVIIAIVATIANTGLSLALIGPLGHVGIALATGVTAWLNAGVLAVGLARNRRLRPDRGLIRSLVGVIVATAAMVAALLNLDQALPDRMAADLLLAEAAVGPLRLGVLVVAGLVTYAVAAVVTGAVDRRRLRAMLRRGKGPHNPAPEPPGSA